MSEDRKSSLNITLTIVAILILFGVIYIAWKAEGDGEHQGNIQEPCSYSDAWVGIWETTHFEDNPLPAPFLDHNGTVMGDIQSCTFKFSPNKTWTANLIFIEEDKMKVIHSLRFSGTYAVHNTELYTMEVNKMKPLHDKEPKNTSDSLGKHQLIFPLNRVRIRNELERVLHVIQVMPEGPDDIPFTIYQDNHYNARNIWFPRLNNPCNGLNHFGLFSVTPN